MLRQLTVMAALAVAVLASNVFAGSLTTSTSAAGDGQFYWNSRYGDETYYGGTTMGIDSYFWGGRDGNDYDVAVFEVPIAAFAGHVLDSATLLVHSNGFDTYYYYGDAKMGWLDVDGATGDIVADDMGMSAKSRPGNLGYIWDSDWGTGSHAGPKVFDVLTCMQTDLAAGRSFSTFVLHGSRETIGSLQTAESGFGPSITATSKTFIPEPASMTLLTIGGIALLRRKH